jgi:ADP-ribosylglycohydrolase
MTASGCLFGLAFGDALGKPTEFMTVAEIRGRYGPGGPREDACRITGAGWIAEEALATGLFCAIRHADDPISGLARAAATSGDSDSIACLTGAFLGAAHGLSVWPTRWTERIEYKDQLAAMGQCWD